MGEPVETLEDLLRPGLRAVCVGINPSRVSVAAGHYYQGRAGQRFFARLRLAGVLSHSPKGREDDIAFANGIGFTDIVKRPTASANELRAEEYAHGREALLAKLVRYKPEFVIFTYKKTATILLGPFAGNGFVLTSHFPESQVFVMPGPYENASKAAETLGTLAVRFDRRRE
jgi:TDG/mug DNA glycosylase family protein